MQSCPVVRRPQLVDPVWENMHEGKKAGCCDVAAPSRAKFSASQALKREMSSGGSSTRYAKQPLDLPASCAAGVQFSVR